MREYRKHDAWSELAALMRRVALAAVIVAVPLAAVAQSNSEPSPILGSALFGGSIQKPNGVGFVLAVGLQRARG